MEINSYIPVWAVAIMGFGLQFWLFCLLPNWINKDADVLTPEEQGFLADDVWDGS